MTILGTAFDIDDAAFGTGHAPAFRQPPQVACVEPGIELEGIAELRQGGVGLIGAGVGELAAQPRDHRQRIGVERGPVAERACLQPMMVELDPLHVDAVEAERVDVAVAEPRPIDEFDPELVGRAGLADEIRLVDPEHRVEQPDLRDRRLADADGADLVGFDQLDRQMRHLAHHPCDARSGHPARGAAADDHHPADRIRPHTGDPVVAANGDSAVNEKVGTSSSAGGGDGGGGGAKPGLAKGAGPQARMKSPWVGSRSATSR